MNWTRIDLDSVTATPWRNGGGVTRELLAWPSCAAWRIRVSVAEVTGDGPFSAYPGIERWFAVLSGRGVGLTWPDRDHALTPQSAPLRFDGGLPPQCRLLAGATLDLNLMARDCQADMRRVGGPCRMPARARSFVAVYANGASASITGDGGLELPPNALAWRILDSDQTIALNARDALWMEIDP